jgi:hypothetical protein
LRAQKGPSPSKTESGLPRSWVFCYPRPVKATSLLLSLVFVSLPLTASAGMLVPTKAEVKRFAKADTDKDELISPTEFTALMKVLSKAKRKRSTEPLYPTPARFR